jgi:Replication-relaxation
MTRADAIEQAAALPERDLALLDLLLQHRFLTRRHIQTLYFSAHHDPHSGDLRATRTPRTAQRRLQLLRRRGLLVRRYLAAPDGRRDPEPYYCLTADGARLACARAELTAAEWRKHASDALANPLFVRHALAAAELHCALTCAAREHHDHECRPHWWRGEDATAAGFNDRGLKVLLRPDGYTRYRAGRDIHHLLAEIDLGTMPLPRLRSKLELYRAYARSRAWQERYPVFPKLLLLTTSERRINQLLEQLGSLRELVLLAGTHERLHLHGPLAPIWQQPGRPGLRPLLEPG